MKDEYDFSETARNPYSKHLQEAVTIRLGVDVIDYFKGLSAETDVPYQTLINMYLRDCVRTQRKPALTWDPHA